MKETDLSAEEIASEVNAIVGELGPLLDQRRNLPAAIALALMAAHHVLHDGGSEDDFLAVARTAWNKSRKTHLEGCS